MSRKKKKLPPFDRYDHYIRAVQSPSVDAEFLTSTYKELRRATPRVLREDFCGTFAICCEWVKLHRENRAIGVDLDPEPLDYGRAHYLSKLTDAQKERVHLVEGSVLTARPVKADVIAALNFSFYFFKSRLMLRQYFARALKGLAKDGVLVVDAFGGPGCMEANEEKNKIDDFWYFWEQKNYNPITAEALFYIHFQRKGEKRRSKVFTYDWRMWTIPEIRDIMLEAGFKRTHVYWEGTDRKGEGNGKFSRQTNGEECQAYVVYIAAEA